MRRQIEKKRGKRAERERGRTALLCKLKRSGVQHQASGRGRLGGQTHDEIETEKSTLKESSNEGEEALSEEQHTYRGCTAACLG